MSKLARLTAVAGLALALTSAANADFYAIFGNAKFSIYGNPLCVECVESDAAAVAITTYCPCLGGSLLYDGDGEADVNLTGSGAAAYANCAFQAETVHAGGSAVTSEGCPVNDPETDPDVATPLITLTCDASFGTYADQPPGTCMCTVQGAVYVTASVVVSIDPECEEETTFNHSSEASFSVSSPTIVRHYVFIGDEGEGVWDSPEGRRLDGATPHPIWPDRFVMSGSAPVVGTAATLKATMITFDDFVLDVNGDGRFNYIDAQKLACQLTSTSSTYVPRFDFNGSGDIDQTDVDVLDFVIAKSLDSGVFGDANQSGSIDCSDAGVAASISNCTLSSSSYIPQLDFDLDGDIDSTDRTALAALPPQDIDYNNDGLFPDTLDITELTSVFSSGPCTTCECHTIDFNGDGLFPDTDDITAFLDAIAGTPCP